MVQLLFSFVNSALPYNVFVCDVYGNQCVLVSQITVTIPPQLTIPIPSQFQNAPAIGVKIVDVNGCEHFEVVYCAEFILNALLLNNIGDYLLVDSNTYLGIQI